MHKVCDQAHTCVNSKHRHLQATLNSEEIKAVAIAIIELYLSEGEG